jgi:hypothetical protein
MEGTRPPTGASPTQPYKCGQYLKIKVNLFISALAKINAVLADDYFKVERLYIEKKLFLFNRGKKINAP